MASACVNNIGMSTDAFLDCPPAYPSFGWLSPRISFSRDFTDDIPEIVRDKPDAGLISTESSRMSFEKPDLEVSGKDFVDFEFHLHDPVAMLPADELFSDGKLVPLQMATVRPMSEPTDEIRSPELLKLRRRDEFRGLDAYAMSPKAPRCSSRWRELLGLKKQQSSKSETQQAASVSSKNLNPKSLKQLLNRNLKSSTIDASLSLPLLRDTDSDPVSLSSRLSLSSSSSGPDHDDIPRLSLDSEKPNQIPVSINRNPPKVRVSRPRSAALEGHLAARAGRSPVRRAPEATMVPTPRSASVDSPRMNSSGKVVFQGLGRSSSSPSTFNGGPRIKHRGMERSYSSNVRVTPVLNVPVCSLRGSSKFGFGQLFSQQKKEREGAASRSSNNSSVNKGKIERERT